MPRIDSSHARAAATLSRGGSFLAFAVILSVFALTAPHFVSPVNLANIVAQSALPGLMAFGLTIVIIGGGQNVVTGGIDLSLAANLGLSAAVYATLVRDAHGDITAIAATLATGTAIGALNAFAVVRLRIPPLLATLATMNLAAGLELVLTQNTVVPADSPWLAVLAGTGPLGAPMLAWALLIIAALLVALVQYTPFGLRLYAVGEYPEAARASGIALKPYVGATYVISGVCGALAALCSAAFFNGSTTGSGDMLLSVVAIAYLGIMFSRRTVPTISGALVAALFVGSLINGFQLLNISSFWVNGVQGVLIIIVVAASTSLRRAKV
ncbi:MAG TPA: ABC transporter permease [Pararobbsia sp.]|jgi:ribose transport system permease protein|nr:ABC transporter permease [Pararobbsia sp.]